MNENKDTEFVFKNYTRTQLKQAFDNALNLNQITPGNGTAWKYPIKAIIPSIDQTVTSDAIAFFVGAYPTITCINENTVTIESPGYYAICD